MKIDNINRDTTCAVLVTASWEPRADDSSEALVFDNPRVPEDVLYSHSEYRANASAATVSLMVSRAPEDVREGPRDVVGILAHVPPAHRKGTRHLRAASSPSEPTMTLH